MLDLKQVGKNLQEQTMNSLGASGNGYDYGGRGPSGMIAYPNLYQVFGDDAQASVRKIESNLGAWAERQAGPGVSREALEDIFRLQAGLIIDGNGKSFGFLVVCTRLR